MVPRALNTAHVVDISGIDSSSMDELALSKLGGQSPLAPRSTNTKIQKVNLGATPKLQLSPKKSFYLETPAFKGSSPARIRVTMQAEQMDAQDEPGTPSKRGRSRAKVIKVPLNDADEPVKRRPGRPRKSDIEPSAVQRRKATPIRRQSKRLSGSSQVQDDVEMKPPPAKKRGRPSKTAPQTDSGMDTQSPKKKVAKPRKSSQIDTDKVSQSPKKKLGRPSKIILEKEPEVDPIDEGFVDDEEADEEQAGRNEATLAEQELLEPTTGSLHEVMPMSDNPSVGQSPHYYARRGTSGTSRNSIGTTRAGLSQYDTSDSIRHPSQELPRSSLLGPSAKAQAGLEFSRASPFDFANLTPLHEKHTIAPTVPIQPHLPAQSTPRPKAGEPFLSRQERNEHSDHEQPIRKNLFSRHSESPEKVQESYSAKSGRFREPTPVPSQFGESQPSEHGSPTSSVARNDEQNQDEEMWRRQIVDRDDDHSSNEEATPASDSDDSDHGGFEEMTGRPMGEETLMQSEEFSMVSLDSLESVRDQNSSFVGGNQAGRSMNEPQRTPTTLGTIPQQPTSVKHPSKLKQAWFPESSPGAHLSPNVSVKRGRHSSRPLSSPNPPESPSNGVKPSPQLRFHEDVSRQLGSRLSLSEFDSSPVGAAPISSFLQSNIQQRLGEVSLPREHIDNIDNNDNALTEPPLAPSSANGRLPTPNSADKESQSTTGSQLETRPDPAGQQFQRSTALESDHSPARSDSVASMQSHTPPATERGSSPVLEEATDLNHNTTFPHLPSSPPARIERSGGLEESRAWLRTQNAMEQTWRKAKQQLSPPSQTQNRSIIISDDESDSDESEQEETLEKDKSMDTEEVIEDLWQEEASRGTNVDDSNLSNRSRSGTSQFKRKLFSVDEKSQSPRPVKVPRTSRTLGVSTEQEQSSQNKNPQRSQSSRLSGEVHQTSGPLSASAKEDISTQAQGSEKVQPPRLTKVPRTSEPFNASPEKTRPTESKKRSFDPEQERQKKVSSTIDDLFKNIAGSSTRYESQDDASSIKPVDRIFPPSSAYSSHGTNKVPQRASTVGGRGESSLSTKPARSSQLRRQLSPKADASFAKQTDSFVSVTSDVQQLRNEMTSSHDPPLKEKRPAPQTTSAQVYSTRTTTQKVPVNMRSIDDSIQSEIGKYDSSSLLSLNPKQPAKPLFQAAPGQGTRPAAAKAAPLIEPTQPKAATPPKAAQDEQPRVEKQMMKSAPPGPPGPGIFDRLKTHIPFLTSSVDISINGPPRPNHHLLSNLSLLPMTLPFTKTHYIVLEELWKRYKAAPELFLTSRPQNAGLMTKSLNKWSEARLSEWGYECTLKPSCLILVALYCRLLVLKDAQEFKKVEGRDLELGESGTLWLEQREREKATGKSKWKMDELIIGQAYVTVRLFSVMVCEIVREDESKGLGIDRELRFKWQAKGERGWNFSLLVDE
ncbi:hypothetical protein BLS_005633 [Venturia inaequalis]|uniref:Uncharacterized protein n=1 Tax=Venturia inaequalis TaxID=5025 RepID=A0A8H3UE35_VENIN|nr:hypothetical protein BLS_005633 [Venturia inaequalis]